MRGMLNAIVDFPKPFVVAVNGVGAGIGATNAEVTIASESDIWSGKRL